jgi:hypothetical protein
VVLIKVFYKKTYIVLSLLFLSSIVSGQVGEPISTDVVSTNQKVEGKVDDWSIGAIASFKPIKTLLIYDIGVHLSRTVKKGQRMSIEAGYRSTYGSTFEQYFGNIPLSIKADISSLLVGARYDWFPFVASSTHGSFLESLKLFGGVLYFSRPEYVFEAGLKEAFVSGDYYFSPEDIGVVVTTIKTNKMQPYLGMGYDQFYAGKKINFSVNAGLMYHGKPQVNMTATKMLKPTAENAGRLEKYFESYQFMPLVQLLIQFNLI